MGRPRKGRGKRSLALCHDRIVRQHTWDGRAGEQLNSVKGTRVAAPAGPGVVERGVVVPLGGRGEDRDLQVPLDGDSPGSMKIGSSELNRGEVDMSRAGTTPAHRPWVAAELDSDQAAELARQTGLSLVVASLLLLRGIEDKEAAEAYLDPSLLSLHDPGEIPDLQTAARRIDEVRREGGTIGIYGDYDVDGVSSTALLVKAFEALGQPVSSYIPDRLTEGYGLNIEALEAMAQKGIDLVITVDGGSNDIAELEFARDRGLEVVVTDHHPIHQMPEGVLLVHPDRPDVASVSRGLSGVG
ncbi:MAG TPA: hypothetical protein EYN79_07585, partial [Planctomycetes bacterium]|nr:hypothetical protein [Planctomycetota bacterium]